MILRRRCSCAILALCWLTGPIASAATLPNLQFLPGRFPPPPPPDTTVYELDGVTISHADTSPRPPREVPPPPPPPPVLPTTTIASGAVVELGGGLLSTHVINNGYAAVGSFRSIGDLSVQGNFSVEEGAYLYFDVRGIDAGQYDLIQTYRQFAMWGTTRLVFRRGFAPQAGDIVPLVYFPEFVNLAMTISPDSFQFANLTSSPYIGIWAADNIYGIRFYADTTFVPEPSAIVIASSALVLGACRRR